MFDDHVKIQKSHGHKDISGGILNLLESLITAFIMALVIVVFSVQPYIIPTGSMADTLRGAHFRMRCSQCGYRYDRNFESREYGLADNSVPIRKVQPPPTRCPSCGHYEPTNRVLEVSKGDKILAIKCLYQFVEPKRWDVVIFKNPVDPSLTYIKRMIGLPKEKVEIIDGDIYINGKIARKPAKIQEELWMPIYENDYQPSKPSRGLFNGHYWNQPFDTVNSDWKTSKSNPTEFVLNRPFGEMGQLKYDSSMGNNFRATYAYNHIRYYSNHPYCSDLMVRFQVWSEEEAGKIGVLLSKYETSYKAWASSSGEMVISRVKNDKETILERKEIDKGFENVANKVEFANIDHKLIFCFGGEKLTYDLGPSPTDAGERKTQLEPQVKILGLGKLTISHVGIFRDIHYTSSMFGNGEENGTATEGNPITLGEDEFFVLGDNSPASADGRWWDKEGIGNNKSYRKGIVPRDYMIGKAMVVFWPGGFKPFERFPFHCVPDFRKLKIIYGGRGGKN